MYPYGLKEDLIVRFEDTSDTEDTLATYKLSDISLECDAIFDKPYATTIGEMYTGTISIPYTKIISIHYRTLYKKNTTSNIDGNNLSVPSLQDLPLLFLDKRDDFADKNKEFYNPSINKVLITINGIPHQPFAAGFNPEIYIPRAKKNISTKKILM